MLEILIIENDIASSPIILTSKPYGRINTLPEKLRERVLKIAEELNEKGYSKAEYYYQENNRSYYGFYQREKYHTESHLCDEVDFEAIADTLELLRWYLGPHLRARDPDLIGGAIICCDCGLTQRRGKPFAEHCEFAGCPSHAKWAQIIEEYEVPQPLTGGGLAKILECRKLT